MFRGSVANINENHKDLAWFLLACLALTILSLSNLRGTSKSKNMSNSPKYISGVYFSNWSVYGAKHFPHDLEIDHLSHVFYAFMKIDGNTGNVGYSDEWADVQMPMAGGKGAIGLFNALKKKKRSLKLIMSIGGWGTAAQFTQVTSDEKKVSVFVETALGLVKEHHFDGIDIDWEYPSNETERELLVSLLRKIRLGLDQIRGGLSLSFAAPANLDNCKFLNVPEMDKLLTFWNIMAYDFAGSSWSSKTAYHSNLYGNNGDNYLNADGVMKYYAKHVDTQKIVLGMPLYGRKFKSPSKPSVGHSFSREGLTDGEVKDYLHIDRNDEKFDKERVSAFGYNEREDLLVTYDNPDSAQIKAKYILDNKFGGGFWWDSKGEAKEKDRKLINTFVKALGGPKALNDTENWI